MATSDVCVDVGLGGLRVLAEEGWERPSHLIPVEEGSLSWPRFENDDRQVVAENIWYYLFVQTLIFMLILSLYSFIYIFI